MKYLIVVLACIAAAAAQNRANAFANYNNNYRPYQYNQYNRPQYKYQTYTTPRPTYAPIFETLAPVATAAPTPYPVQAAAKVYNADARSANIVRQENDISPDGAFSYFFETDNGIVAQEQGTPKQFAGNPPVVPVVTQGSFSWTSPEGQPIVMTYTADENGYHPEGNAIPVGPEVPAQIARALAYTAKYIGGQQ